MAFQKKITKYSGTDTNVQIPSSVDGVLVREIEDDAFADTNVTEIHTNRYLNEITGAPWGATDAEVYWLPEKKLQSIQVTTPPTKISYKEGEVFDPTGMVVTAIYEDSTTQPITTYEYSPLTALTLSDTVITITYHGKTTTQNIIVEDARTKIVLDWFNLSSNAESLKLSTL